jgi:hypothetical protein
VLGRRTKTETPAADVTVQVVDKLDGKGRPTPKRREAETLRKERVKPPADRKEAYRQTRQRARAQKDQQRQALLKGDEKALPPRDRGPVRAYVRDHVDSRRTAAEFFLPFAVIVLLLSFLNSPVLVAIGVYAWMVMLVGIIVDSFLVVRSVKRQVARRFPGEPTKGLAPYALMRSLQMRRLRLPPPRVKPGTKL